MWNPRPVRQLRDLSAWHLNSHRVARRNALDAHRALATRRRERVEVEQFLEGFLEQRQAPEEEQASRQLT